MAAQDGFRSRLTGVYDRVGLADRRVTGANRSNVLEELTVADGLSLCSLLVAWASVLVILAGELNSGILLMFLAYGFDKLDGAYARWAGIDSRFGRQIDSFIDVFAYLVTGALIYHVALAPTLAASVVVGFLVIALGGLRLVRHNAEGFGDDDGASFYHGTTVVHTNVVVVVNFLLAPLLPVWNGWAAGLTIVLAATLMVSNLKTYKTDTSHALAALTVLALAGAVLFLEFGG